MISLEDILGTSTWTRTNHAARIKQLIQERCGLYYQDRDLKNIEKAVATRMQSCGVSSVDPYLRLLTHPDGREFRELLNLLTIRHTYFFRIHSQFTVLREAILPCILEARQRASGSARPCLRIWSAGCSTGEEPYSIAMVVSDLIKDPGKWDIEILATDVSTHALEAARQGIYGEGSMKRVSAGHRRRHFTETPDLTASGRRYQVRDTLRALVRFTYCNLLEAAFPKGLDVIFCRNVMIYFDRPTVDTLIDRFHDSLVEGGYLFLGHSEGLLGSSAGFRLIEHGDGLYYQKVPRGSDRQSSRTRPLKDLPKTMPQDGCRPVPDVPVVALAQVERAVRDKDYDRALALIGPLRRLDGRRVEPYYWAAHVHTNRGDYDLARGELEHLLRIDEFFAPAYYLLGQIDLQEEDTDSAKVNLKKAVFLDPRLTMALVTLAMVYQQEGKTAEAIREYRNAAKLLTMGQAETEVPYSGGFTRATLAGVCREAVERMQSEP